MIPLSRAVLCGTCDTVFDAMEMKRCPKCCSAEWVQLVVVLQCCGEGAEKEAAESYQRRASL